MSFFVYKCLFLLEDFMDKEIGDKNTDELKEIFDGINELKQLSTLIGTYEVERKIEGPTKEVLDKEGALVKKLEDKYKELINKKDENNKLFVKNQDKVRNKKKSDKEIDLEELKKKSDELGVKIGKCHFVGRLLMAGKTWDSIYVEYNKNEKYKSKNEKITEKFGKDTINKTLGQIGKNVAQIMEIQNVDNEKNKGETALTQPSKFEQKHPKLANILNKVKNIFKKKDKNKVKEQLAQDTENSETKSQRDEFIDYLKQVAEKGKDGIEKQNREAAKERLEAKKKEAYERETSKFGKAYAEKSYTNESKEDDEEQL